MVDLWSYDSDSEYNYEISNSNNYFKKINSLLNHKKFNLYLNYDIFIKKYNIEELLSNFLISNLKYYNSYFNIPLVETEISMFSICLANIYVDDNFRKQLEIYLQYKWSYNNILFVFLNIIDNDNLDLFKLVYDKYSKIFENSKISYSKINYNIVNHSLLCSKSIFEYICNDISVFKYIKPHIELNLYIDNSYDFLNIISNNIVKFNYNNKIQKWIYNQTENGYIYSLTSFMNSCLEIKHNNNINYKTYNKLIELFILKINDFEIINEYLTLCIKNKNYYLLKSYFNKRKLILKDLNFNSLLHFLVDMFDNANCYNNSIQNNIINIWDLIFPFVKKYSLNYIDHYFNSNCINNLVAFKKSISIIKQIEPYISDWNKSDYCDYTPILDAIRYSKFETVFYMIMNYEIDLNIESLDYNTILSCALMNSDIRVINYIYKYILDNNIILNEDNCITILQDHDLNSFKKYKKKFDIFISLCGKKHISSILEKLIYYKPLVKHIIKKYDYKIVFKKIHLNNKKTYNCSNLNKEYLKYLVDNIDYSKSNYNLIIVYICNIGCIDLVIEIFEYMLTKIYFNKIDISKCNCTNLFLKVYDNIKNNDCINCQGNHKIQFIKYIDFMKKKIIRNNDSLINTDYYSNLKNYDDISDVLFKNGLYFTKYLYNNYIDDSKINNINSLCFIKLINLKRKELLEKHTYAYTNTEHSVTFLNWCIVICKLKMYVRKRYNKCKQSFIHKIQNIHNEINVTKTISINNIPIHLTPIDCYKPLNLTHRYISVKVDGIYKKGIFDVYPDLNEDLNEDLNQDLEYEFIKDDNICYIFESYETTLDLRNKHPYIKNKIYPNLNLNNYKTILLDYNKLESIAINNFINSNKFKKKWWAKYVFKIEEMCHLDYLSLLHNISQLSLDFIPNDGWILNGNDCIYKIKPKELLTLDLLCKSNRLYDKQNNVYDHISNSKLINNTIYRCYYNNVWQPKEIRYDKFVPNDDTICKFIEKSHKLPWNINDIKLINSYYQKKPFNNYKQKSINNVNKNVLNLGCGYCKKYVGIDIDPKILNHNTSNEIYICDLTKNWNMEEQIEEFNNAYHYLPNINDFNKKYNNYTFDYIISSNSIHYLLNSCHDVLFKNINKYTHKNSLFKIKFLDKELIDSILNENNYISKGSSFVRKYDNSKIKIYYHTTHIQPIIEKTYSKNNLEQIFNKYGWKLKDYNKNYLNKYISNWDNYFRCFSDLTFIKVI